VLLQYGRKEGIMTRRLGLVSLVASVLVVAWPAVSGATEPNNQANSYQFFLEVPNVAQTPTGDMLSLTGEGTFGVHPKSATGGGSFTFTPAAGTGFDGTWTVNKLVDFQPYGCGIVFGTPLPPNLCGGRLVLEVTATTPFGPIRSQVTISCVIGATTPPTAEEGVRIVVPRVGDFNRQIEGMNVYVKL
jgi:hypothetical protein